MSRRRYPGQDLTYSDDHRDALPFLYRRHGHRLDQADRDWTEFCHFCKEPLAIYEEVRDVGQDLMDKAVTVTRRLAVRAQLRAGVLAWRTDRPADVQHQIDELNREVRRLEALHPITGFRVRNLWPTKARSFIDLEPEEWWQWVLIIHRSHHRFCPAAQHPDNRVRLYEFEEARGAHPLFDNVLFDCDEPPAAPTSDLWLPSAGRGGR